MISDIVIAQKVCYQKCTTQIPTQTLFRNKTHSIEYFESIRFWVLFSIFFILFCRCVASICEQISNYLCFVVEKKNKTRQRTVHRVYLKIPWIVKMPLNFDSFSRNVSLANAPLFNPFVEHDTYLALLLPFGVDGAWNLGQQNSMKSQVLIVYNWNRWFLFLIPIENTQFSSIFKYF